MVFFNSFTLDSSEEKLDKLIQIMKDIYGCVDYNISKKEDSIGEKRVIVKFKCYAHIPLINGLPKLIVKGDYKSSLENIEELVTYFSHKISTIIFEQNSDVAMITSNTLFKCNDLDSFVKELVHRGLVTKGCKMDRGSWLIVPKSEDIVIVLGKFKDGYLYIDDARNNYLFDIDDGYTNHSIPICQDLQDKFLEWRAKKEFILPVVETLDITDFSSKNDEKDNDCIRCKQTPIKTYSGISSAGIHYE